MCAESALLIGNSKWVSTEVKVYIETYRKYNFHWH